MYEDNQADIGSGQSTDEQSPQTSTVVIEDSVTFDSVEMTAYELYLMSKKGRYNVEAQIGVRRGMLQRRIQKIKWRQKNYARSKSFLASFIKGSADTESFMLVPAHLVLKSLVDKLKHEVEESVKETLRQTIKEVQDDLDNGVEFYLLDGQNRLFEAFTPFFSGKLQLGTDKLTAKVNGDKVTLSGKTFEQLPSELQDYIKNKKVFIHEATDGDIDTFVEAIIAKNSNVGWGEWQRTLTQNTFTPYRGQIEDIMVDEDSLVSDKVFSKIKEKPYQLDVDGYELLISELLVWLTIQEQPKKGDVELHKSFFKGEHGRIVSDRSVDSLRKYLREFAKTKMNSKNINHVVLRNYVMFRYAMDNRKKEIFKNIDLPIWKVTRPVEFVSEFVMLSKALYKVKGAYNYHKDKSGNVVKKDKVPGFLPYANSDYKKPLLLQRIRILSKGFMEKEDKLSKKSIITVMSDDFMPSVEDAAIMNDMKDYKGRTLSASKVVRRKGLHRGHKIPKSQGGSNQNVVLQSSKSNIDYGAVELDEAPMTETNID